MNFSARDPKGFFEERTDPEVERNIVRRVLTGWGQTKTEMEDGSYPHDIIRYLFPQVRRGKVDALLLGIVGIPHLSATVDITLAPNKNASAHHALISLPHARLTASAVRTPNTLVRPAGFRNNYIRLQPGFEHDEKHNKLMIPEEVSLEETIVYGVIIHGPTQGDLYRCGFVHIVFLDADGVYLEERIKLEEKYPDVINEFIGAEQVPDTAKVQTWRHVQRTGSSPNTNP